jgi:hypothetical protein
MAGQQMQPGDVVGGDKRATGSQAALGLLIGALITPVTLFLAIVSAAGGHGSYRYFAVFYPLDFLLMRSAVGSVSLQMVLILAATQFPAYGAIIGAFKGALRALVTCLIGLIHSLAMYLCFYPRGPFG